MTNIQILRDHTGKLNLVVGDEYAVGAHVAGISTVPELGLVATVLVPLKDATLGEVKNVVPFARRR